MKKLVFSLALFCGMTANAQQLLEVLKSHTTSINLPPNVKLGGGTTFIASIYDEDYLPYSKPDTPAVWTSVSADSNPESKVIDYQGSITEEGKVVYIPITVTGSGNTTIPAYTANPVAIETYKTEDGQSRNIVISWEEQVVTADTKILKAKIKTVSGTLNVKKLDLNGGLGNDNKGVLLANLTYPASNTDNSTANYEVRAISGIPDRHFRSTIITPDLVRKVYNIPDNEPVDLPDLSYMNREYIYIPMATPDGKIWLNNNLGAAYSDINSEHFNPGQQAQDDDDFRAFGHLFQWQRPADGHERFYWTGPQQVKHSFNPRIVNSQYLASNISSSSLSLNEIQWAPHKSKLYLSELLNNKKVTIFMANANRTANVGYYYWSDVDHKPKNDIQLNLWQVGGAHNPCPEGFHVPTHKEFLDLIISVINEENIYTYYSIKYLLYDKIPIVRNIMGGLISNGIVGLKTEISYRDNVLWMSDTSCETETNNVSAYQCLLPKFEYSKDGSVPGISQYGDPKGMLGVGMINAETNDISAQVRCVQD